MSKPLSEGTADVPVKNKTGTEVDRYSSGDLSFPSLSSFSKPTTRSAQRVHTPTSSIRSRRDSNDEINIPEPWMETVTPGKFDRFQAAIFRAVGQIIIQPEYQNHPFTKKWNRLRKLPRTPMTSTITWRNVKVILSINDLFEYRDFLQQCPNLNNYIRITPSVTTTRGFDFGVYDYSSLTMEEETKLSADAVSTIDDVSQPPTPEPSINIFSHYFQPFPQGLFLSVIIVHFRWDANVLNEVD